MTLDEVIIKAYDSTGDIIQTIKVLKEEIVKLSEENSKLKKELEDNQND